MSEGRTVTPVALGVFFTLASLITLAAGVSLLSPGEPLDVIWRAKPRAHEQLLALGWPAGAAFLAFSAAFAGVAAGSLDQRLWGWRAAIAVFVLNGLAEAARIAFGAVAEGMTGVAVTTAVVWWLTRPRVRAVFER